MYAIRTSNKETFMVISFEVSAFISTISLLKGSSFIYPGISEGHLESGDECEGRMVPFDCRGSISSSCTENLCQIRCSDGTNLELNCKCGGINMRQIGRKMNVGCGRKIRYKKCFPFCRGKRPMDNIEEEEEVGQTLPNSPGRACFPFCDENGNPMPNSPMFPCFPFCSNNNKYNVFHGRRFNKRQPVNFGWGNNIRRGRRSKMKSVSYYVENKNGIFLVKKTVF